jgi:hypothetical protein
MHLDQYGWLRVAAKFRVSQHLGHLLKILARGLGLALFPLRPGVMRVPEQSDPIRAALGKTLLSRHLLRRHPLHEPLQ